MSADIINLRKARKARDRAGKERQAEENRVKFGRTKGEREKAEQSRDMMLRRLEGHQLSKTSEDDGEQTP